MREGLLNNDYASLDNDVNKVRVYKLAEVRDKIEKVAFDVVRFKEDNDLDNLWIIKPSDEGDIIVAMYDDKEQLEAKSEWEAIPDKKANVNIFYSKEHLKTINASSLGVSDSEVSGFCRTIRIALASDVEFRNSFLNEFSDNERKFLFDKYPELKG